MAWDEDVIADKGRPGSDKVGESDGGVDFAGTRIASDLELEAPLLRVAKVAFLKGTLVIDGEFSPST